MGVLKERDDSLWRYVNQPLETSDFCVGFNSCSDVTLKRVSDRRRLSPFPVLVQHSSSVVLTQPGVNHQCVFHRSLVWLMLAVLAPRLFQSKQYLLQQWERSFKFIWRSWSCWETVMWALEAAAPLGTVRFLNSSPLFSFSIVCVLTSAFLFFYFLSFQSCVNNSFRCYTILKLFMRSEPNMSEIISVWRLLFCRSSTVISLFGGIGHSLLE